MSEPTIDLSTLDATSTLSLIERLDAAVHPLAEALPVAAALVTATPRLQAAHDRLAAAVETLKLRKSEAEASTRQAERARDEAREQAQQEATAAASARETARRAWQSEEDAIRARVSAARKELEKLKLSIGAA